MDELITRLKERRDIMRESPGVTVTYADMARTINDILLLVEKIKKERIGFDN